ncbi:Porphobilinogen deaminase [Buchnera aphidicola (Thelaxes suberi)]|uniref:hydroxymethylbilane synthase n=1 Tax=Buchnera aphidicola TaxID=9 RepID=UPI00346449B6
MFNKHNYLRIATRKSPLALIQAESVKNKLSAIYPNLNIQLIPIKTHGDIIAKKRWNALNGKGIFIKELEIALLENIADIAIHSVKDLPIINMSTKLCLSTVLKRGNPLDALISNMYNKLQDLPKGAIIGTSSLRRQCQLLHYRPDLIVHPVHGNIETRLKKLDEGKYDAIILSVEGLNRLNLHNRINEVIPLNISLPSCGQGAIGIQSRIQDTKIHKLLKKINHKNSFLRIQAERLLCFQLNAGCYSPVGSYASIKKNKLSLKGLIGSNDGKKLIRGERTGSYLEIKKMSYSLALELLKNKDINKLN